MQSMGMRKRMTMETPNTKKNSTNEVVSALCWVTMLSKSPRPLLLLAYYDGRG